MSGAGRVRLPPRPWADHRGWMACSACQVVAGTPGPQEGGQVLALVGVVSSSRRWAGSGWPGPQAVDRGSTPDLGGELAGVQGAGVAVQRAPASRSRMRPTTYGSWPARRPRRRPVPAAPQPLGQPALMVACPKRRSVPARRVPARRRRLAEDRRRVERVGGLGPLAGLHPPAAAAAATDRTAKRAPRPGQRLLIVGRPRSRVSTPPRPGQHAGTPPVTTWSRCAGARRWRGCRRPHQACPGRSGGPGITLGARRRLALGARRSPSTSPRSRSLCSGAVHARPRSRWFSPPSRSHSASSRLLRLAQPGVLVLKPGQTPAQPARACRPRPVCSPWPPSTRAPKATTATPSLKNPQSQDGAACPWRSPPRSG